MKVKEESEKKDLKLNIQCRGPALVDPGKFEAGMALARRTFLFINIEI